MEQEHEILCRALMPLKPLKTLTTLTTLTTQPQPRPPRFPTAPTPPDALPQSHSAATGVKDDKQRVTFGDAEGQHRVIHKIPLVKGTVLNLTRHPHAGHATGGRTVRRVLDAESGASLVPAFSGSAPDIGTVVLRGDLDSAFECEFAVVLARAGLRSVRGAMVIDMAAVQYADYRFLVALDRFAEGNGISILLRSASPGVARLIGLLRLRRLQLTEEERSP
jgi:anti-anti-sigma regulatory factor